MKCVQPCASLRPASKKWGSAKDVSPSKQGGSASNAFPLRRFAPFGYPFGMKTENLQALADDGQAYVVVRSTPLILGSGLEGMPSFRLTSGEALVPTGEPNRFKLANKDVTLTVTEAA